MSRPRVFIASPYSSDPEGGTRRAIEAFHVLLDAGCSPFCPLFTHYAELVRSRPYSEWCAYDLEWLVCCHAVLRLPGPSPGADYECARAEELGIPVFHTLEALEAWRRGQEGLPRGLQKALLTGKARWSGRKPEPREPVAQVLGDKLASEIVTEDRDR